MCDMTRAVCLVALFFSPCCGASPRECGAPDTTEGAETVCITSVFSVDIEYPNFLVSIFARLAGAHTDSLTFVEWDIRTPHLSSFLLHLTDDDDQRWFEIASDSIFPSFVQLPLEDRTLLVPSALAFFRDALQFFRSTAPETLHATFAFGHDTLGASVFRLSRSPDTGSAVMTVSHVETWNGRTGEEYNSAEVTAITGQGYTEFRDIKVFLKRKGILLRLTPVRATVVRSTY
ncbi:MAG: hypothetical protein WB626_03020 [Bacteroidota bacterium]